MCAGGKGLTVRIAMIGTGLVLALAVQLTPAVAPAEEHQSSTESRTVLDEWGNEVALPPPGREKNVVVDKPAQSPGGCSGTVLDEWGNEVALPPPGREKNVVVDKPAQSPGGCSGTVLDEWGNEVALPPPGREKNVVVDKPARPLSQESTKSKAGGHTRHKQ